MSSGTSKVSVIKEALDIYWWQEWMSGWIGEWMNEWCDSVQYWKLFLNFEKGWYLRKFFSLSFLHIYIFFLTVISCYLLLSLSHALSQEKFLILWNWRLISVYFITSQHCSDWWNPGDFLYLLFKEPLTQAALLSNAKYVFQFGNQWKGDNI